VFLLWAIPVGLVLGWLLGGRVGALSNLGFRWAGLALAGLLVQVVLFTPTGDDLAGAWGPPIYVASTAAVFVAVARNLRIRGLEIVALGALSNLAAIALNGGAMPADPAALRTAGLDGPGAHTNSVVIADPVLRPLTDIFAVPAGIPFANVFSVGDVLIGLGIVVAIVVAMRSGATRNAGTTSPGAPGGGSAGGT
jgi:uncharacterized protein DUF5317